MAARVLAVIPARLGSQRFARKVIHPYRGRPLIAWLYEELKRCREINRLVVATDSREISRVMKDYGADVELTGRRHQTGSDRVAEVSQGDRSSLVVNIQADTLGLKATTLDSVIRRFRKDRSTDVGTIVRRLDDPHELTDPNSVKVVLSADDRALWFSRSAIPFLRGEKPNRWLVKQPYWHHVGVYLFRKPALQAFAGSKRTAAEKAESLEQLRLLEHGWQVRAYKTKVRVVSIDSPRDLPKLDAYYG